MIIGVIGGGPAGLIAGYYAKSPDNQVYIIEKNEKLGKKIYITGKGRCNVTNQKCVGQDFLNNIVSNSKFLYSTVSKFDYFNTVELIESHGCKLKVERGGRVFPISDKASDITKALIRCIDEKGVKVKLNSNITNITKLDNQFDLLINNCEHFLCDKLIIATGGKTYPTTGSTGDGYKFAQSFGHSIIKPKPSLVAIPLKDDFVKDLEGLPLKNVSLNLANKDKLILSFFGEAMFTDKEISGPIALSMSAHLVEDDETNDLYIDFKPALTQEQLLKRINQEIDENLNKDLENLMKSFLPIRLIKTFLNVCKISGQTKCNAITKPTRLNIVQHLKHFSLKYRISQDFERAVITSGGIDVKEINAKTMESKLCKNLYFAGEVIDVDAYTGGYNMQVAMSTGYVAGISCKEDC